MKCKRCGKRLWLAALSGKKLCDACEGIVQQEARRQRGLEKRCYQELAALLETGEGAFSNESVGATLAKYDSEGLRNAGKVKRSVFSAVTAVFAEDEVITDRERKQLSEVKNILGLSDADVGDIHENLVRMESLWAIRRGELPVLESAGVPLQKSETAHFGFDDVEFHQEQVVRSGYEGGSRGVSIRIAKGVYYRMGAHRGERVTETALVRLDTGRLVLTSKRLIFAGREKAFAIPLRKILSMNGYADGVSIVRDSTAKSNKPFVFLYRDAELLNLALSACVNAG